MPASILESCFPTRIFIRASQGCVDIYKCIHRAIGRKLWNLHLFYKLQVYGLHAGDHRATLERVSARAPHAMQYIIISKKLLSRRTSVFVDRPLRIEGQGFLTKVHLLIEWNFLTWAKEKLALIPDFLFRLKLVWFSFISSGRWTPLFVIVECQNRDRLASCDEILSIAIYPKTTNRNSCRKTKKGWKKNWCSRMMAETPETLTLSRGNSDFSCQCWPIFCPAFQVFVLRFDTKYQIGHFQSHNSYPFFTDIKRACELLEKLQRSKYCKL